MVSVFKTITLLEQSLWPPMEETLAIRVLLASRNVLVAHLPHSPTQVNLPTDTGSFCCFAPPVSLAEKAVI